MPGKSPCLIAACSTATNSAVSDAESLAVKTAKHLLQVPKTWKRTLRDANVAKRRLYDCRSTFCTRMYAAGIAPMLIELLMGHAGSGLVHTYAKADDDFKRDAAAKLEAFIASKSSTENTPATSSSWVN